MGNCAGRIYHSRNVVNLCIDTYDEEKQCGELWSQYLGGPAAFTSLFEALEKMEDLYDALQYPFASTETRSFLPEGSRKRRGRGICMREDRSAESFDDVISHRGRAATFIVRVQYRQNSSWQGDVVWMDTGKRTYFESILELVKLIDAAHEKEGGTTLTGEE